MKSWFKSQMDQYHLLWKTWTKANNITVVSQSVHPSVTPSAAGSQAVPAHPSNRQHHLPRPWTAASMPPIPRRNPPGKTQPAQPMPKTFANAWTTTRVIWPFADGTWTNSRLARLLLSLTKYFRSTWGCVWFLLHGYFVVYGIAWKLSHHHL